MSEVFNILVTGGGGYLGSVLVPELLIAGHKVTVLDNFMYNQNSLAGSCANRNFVLVRGDVRDQRLIREHSKSMDIILPLAALVGAPLCEQDKIGATSINVDSVKMLTNTVSAAQNIIMPVTNSGYGIGQGSKYCNEDTPLKPISLYGQTKVKAEEFVLDRGNGVSLRLATVFGMSPRMRLDLLVNDFVYRAVFDRAIVLFESHFKRNYIHVRDVARAFLHVISNFDKFKGEPFNVGISDANISKWELCSIIKRQLPNFMFMEAPIGEDPDKRDYIISNDKFEATGYRTQYSLEDGIIELIKGFQMVRNYTHRNT